MKRSTCSIDSALASSSMTKLSKFLDSDIWNLCFIWYFFRLEHFIDWIDINVTFRILSFVIFLSGTTKVWLPWELLLYFQTINQIAFRSFRFIIMNSLIENFDFFWLHIILLLWLLVISCTCSLLSKDTLYFQVCFEFLFNHLVLVGSKAM